MTDINEQIRKKQKEITQLEHKQNRLLAKQKVIERKKRTRRLIERGAILESVISNAEDFSNEQLQTLLIEIFSSEFAKGKIKNFREHTASEGNPLFEQGRTYTP